MRATQRSVGFLTASLVGVSLVAANVGASTKPAAVPMAFSVPQDVTALQTVLTHYQVPRLPRPGMVEWLEISERGSSGTFGQPAKWTMLRRVRVARAGRGVVALKPLGIGEWPLQAKLLGPSGKLLVESPIDNIRAYGSVTFGALCKSGAATCQGGQTTVVELGNTLFSYVVEDVPAATPPGSDTIYENQYTSCRSLTLSIAVGSEDGDASPGEQGTVSITQQDEPAVSTTIAEGATGSLTAGLKIASAVELNVTGSLQSDGESPATDVYVNGSANCFTPNGVTPAGSAKNTSGL